MSAIATNNVKQLEEIARLYYEDGYTQIEIAKRLGLSRPSVSNKLSEAKRLGIVRIFIHSQGDDTAQIQFKLRSKLNIKDIYLVPVPEDAPDFALDITVRVAAEHFIKLLKPEDCLGVAWGHTIRVLSRFIPANVQQVEVIAQIVGSISESTDNVSPDGMIRELSQKLNVKNGYTLPVPVIVENPLIANSLLYDKNVRQTLDNIKKCNKLIVNIALPDESTCLYQQGYLSKEDLNKLNEKGAVGSICNRFYNAKGEAIGGEIDDRTLGITIPEIRRAQSVMSCIVGPQKAYAVYCAMKAGFMNYVILDSITGERILDIIEQEEKSKNGT